jgi:hypothetical protein
MQYVDFTPAENATFQFVVVLDGVQYNAVARYNLFGQRYYLHLYSEFGALILCTPIVGSPDGYDISLLKGGFVSTLVFRTSANRFEISDQPVEYPDFGKRLSTDGPMLDAQGRLFILDQSVLASDTMLGTDGQQFVLDQSQMGNETMLGVDGQPFTLDQSSIK